MVEEKMRARNCLMFLGSGFRERKGLGDCFDFMREATVRFFILFSEPQKINWQSH